VPRQRTRSRGHATGRSQSISLRARIRPCLQRHHPQSPAVVGEHAPPGVDGGGPYAPRATLPSRRRGAAAKPRAPGARRAVASARGCGVGGRVRARVRCGRSRPRAGAVWVVVPAMGSMVKVRVVARSNAGRSPNRKPSPATCCARRGPAQLPGARSRGCRFGSVRNFENRNRNVSWTCTSRNSPGSVGSLRREGRGRARMLASLTSPWALPHACMLRSASPTSRRICGTCERDAACPISTG
jgi:hypothetical protein